MAEKTDPQKRNTPESLQKVLNIDKAVTKKFCGVVEKILPLPKYRKYYKVLEYSCHTLTWIFGSLAALWLLWNEDLFQTQINLLFALFLDCLVIAVTKAFVRRRRPASNTDDMFLTVGVDAYSFPSGHVSRAVMVTFFTTSILHSNILIVMLSITWAFCVSVSRVLMKRHHMLDVLGGVAIGLLEGQLMSLLWLSRSTSIWLVNYLSSEAVDLEGLQDGDDLPDLD